MISRLNSFQAESMIVSFFVTAENGILLQDAFPMSPVCEKLTGIEIPYLYFVKKVLDYCLLILLTYNLFLDH